MGKDLKGKELGKGISQRKDGYYVARFTSKSGKRVQKLFQRLSECKKWLRETEYIDQHSNLEFANDILVSAWYDYWIDNKKRYVRYHTAMVYENCYKRHIAPLIGNKILREVTTIDCQRILNKMADNDYSVESLSLVKRALYNILEYACQNDLLIKNPCNKAVKANMGRKTKERRALTIDEQKTFYGAIKGVRYENQYRLVLQTGLRTSELVGLQWSDVNFKDRLLAINRTLEYRTREKIWAYGAPKTAAGTRTIPLTQEAIKILEKQKRINAELPVIQVKWKDVIFLTNDGYPVKNQNYNSGLYVACKMAGIEKFSMHNLRHTFATRCIESEMLPKTLQVILGHTDIKITMNRYVHTTEDHKRREMMKLERAASAFS